MLYKIQICLITIKTLTVKVKLRVTLTLMVRFRYPPTSWSKLNAFCHTGSNYDDWSNLICYVVIDSHPRGLNYTHRSLQGFPVVDMRKQLQLPFITFIVATTRLHYETAGNSFPYSVLHTPWEITLIYSQTNCTYFIICCLNIYRFS